MNGEPVNGSQQSSWERRKPLIIGLAAVALVASMFIPARLGGRLVGRYEESKGQIASIRLVEKTEDAAIFEVSSAPENFYIAASVSMGDVEVGSYGYVANSSGLKLDGSYEYDHDFIFAQEGSLFQWLIGYYRPFPQGHVVGRVDSPEGASSMLEPASESGESDYFSQVDPIMTAAKVSIGTIDESIAQVTNGDTPNATDLHRAGEQLRAAADALSRLSPSAEDAELHAELIAMYHAYGSGALEMEAALKHESAQSWERVNDLMAEGNRHSAAIEKIAKARGLVP